MNLLLTLLFGLALFIGVIIIFIFKNTKKINEISLSIAFVVLLLLMVFEIIPEIFEIIKPLTIILFALLGFILLNGLDFLIPEHKHSNKNTHILHISLITITALVLHNIVEGMALFTTLNTNLNLGILLGLGISLHNIPLGMIIATTLKDSGFSNKKIILISFFVSMSSFIGALIINVLNEISDVTLGIMLSLTLGMLIYIVFFELLHHIKHQNKNNNIIGIIIAIMLFLVSLFL